MNRINRRFPSPCGVWVVSHQSGPAPSNKTFPSPCGVWVVSELQSYNTIVSRFPSPCGVWVVSMCSMSSAETTKFPSPCGVWVVSAKLHILFGAIGKRIVNSAILLYHIGRWFINSKLRNCKVPCEAHKTAT